MNEILDISADAYHQGAFLETPSLSASIAHILVTQSPLHAWTAHPRLNPNWQRVDDKKFDVGTVAHDLILDKQDVVMVVDADSFRTKAAQEARDLAYSQGRVPLLPNQYAEVCRMVDAINDQLLSAGYNPRPFIGEVEKTLVWEADDVVCKARLDALLTDQGLGLPAYIDDLKTTSRSANPEHFARRLYDHGYDLKAAFYIRGVEQITGVTPKFRWVVVETSPPYALSVISPGEDVLELGRRKMRYALETWRRCLETDVWPAYPSEVVVAELPVWEEARWLAREVTS